uniref:Choline transporter-like protein 2 n=1 Tax=Tanacetum cinerariifolium TaxID=118510 RepID=A0A6L2N5T9_TANCI|nr:choline transporter-like protein 2 [Tanacetum cinerariifolium]
MDQRSFINTINKVFNDVATAILEEENRRNNREDTQTSSRHVEALVVMRGKSTKHGSSRILGKFKSGRKKGYKCLKCGNPSHFKKDFRGLNTSYPHGNVASTSEDENALCCEATVANEDGYVYSYNDHGLKIIGIRSIMVKMYDGTIHTIHDVQHVKGLKNHLLSLRKLDDHGCKARRNQKAVHNGIHSSTKWSDIADLRNLVRKSKGNVGNYKLGRSCLFLGYADGVQGYRLWDLSAHKVVVSENVVFMEEKIQENEEGDSTTRETTSIQMEKQFQSNNSSEVIPQHGENETTESQAPTTHTLNRERKHPAWHSDYVMESNVAYCLLTSANVCNDLYKTRHCTCSGSSDLNGSKSTTGYVFTLCGETISWVSKLQSVVAMSTTEAEYVTAVQARISMVENDKICAYDCYVNIMCYMIAWIGWVRLPNIYVIVWIGWVPLPSICVVIRADGYAYPDNAAKDKDPKCCSACCRITKKVNGLVEVEGVEDLGKVGNQRNIGNQNGNVVNENVQENIGNVIVNGNQVGCSYKKFLACNPKEYDGKGGAVVRTRWIEKIESVQDMSGCSIDQKVKYTVGSFVGKDLTWWNSSIRMLSREVVNHAMVGASHAAYTVRFHELARLVPHLVTPKSRKIERYVYILALRIREMVAATEPKTIQKAVHISNALADEAVRNESIEKVEKRRNMEEPSKDKSGRDDNKRTRTGNAFASTANLIGRENMGAWPKCTTCNPYHAPGGPCRTCFNYNRPGHLIKDCRGVPRNVNPVNARNLLLGHVMSVVVPTMLVKSPYRLAPSELEELSGQLKELSVTSHYSFLCVEWIIKSVNHNAYIMIAITGESFFTASAMATNLIKNDIVRIGKVNVIGNIILFLGKFCVSLASALFAFLMLDTHAYKSTHNKVSSLLIPMLVCCGLGFMVATLFFALVEVSINTIILSYCQYSEEQRGTTQYATPLLIQPLDEQIEMDRQLNKYFEFFETLMDLKMCRPMIMVLEDEGILWKAPKIMYVLAMLFSGTHHIPVKRILVGEDVTVEVKNAKEVYVLQRSATLHLSMKNSTSQIHNKSHVVFEDESSGVVCYKDDKGEIICEAYDEGPRLEQQHRFSKFSSYQRMAIGAGERSDGGLFYFREVPTTQVCKTETTTSIPFDLWHKWLEPIVPSVNDTEYNDTEMYEVPLHKIMNEDTMVHENQTVTDDDTLSSP